MQEGALGPGEVAAAGAGEAEVVPQARRLAPGQPPPAGPDRPRRRGRRAVQVPRVTRPESPELVPAPGEAGIVQRAPGGLQEALQSLGVPAVPGRSRRGEPGEQGGLRVAAGLIERPADPIAGAPGLAVIGVDPRGDLRQLGHPDRGQRHLLAAAQGGPRRPQPSQLELAAHGEHAGARRAEIAEQGQGGRGAPAGRQRRRPLQAVLALLSLPQGARSGSREERADLLQGPVEQAGAEGARPRDPGPSAAVRAHDLARQRLPGEGEVRPLPEEGGHRQDGRHRVVRRHRRRGLRPEVCQLANGPARLPAAGGHPLAEEPEDQIEQDLLRRARRTAGSGGVRAHGEPPRRRNPRRLPPRGEPAAGAVEQREQPGSLQQRRHPAAVGEARLGQRDRPRRRGETRMEDTNRPSIGGHWAAL